MGTKVGIPDKQIDMVAGENGKEKSNQYLNNII